MFFQNTSTLLKQPIRNLPITKAIIFHYLMTGDLDDGGWGYLGSRRQLH